LIGAIGLSFSDEPACRHFLGATTFASCGADFLVDNSEQFGKSIFDRFRDKLLLHVLLD
jgi:hypothetical protein